MRLTALFALMLLPHLLLVGPALAQTRIVQTPAVPADSRPNNPAVPDAYAINGAFERVVIIRVKFQADLLRGIEEMVKKEGIRNGVILSGIGSLRGYHVHQVNNRDFPTSNIFTRMPDTPADLV